MNKQELVTRVSEQTGMKKKECAEVLDAVLKTITESLVKKEKVALVGFGTFETRIRAARKGRNPKMPDKEIEIPSSNVPVFKAGKTFKNIVNEK